MKQLTHEAQATLAPRFFKERDVANYLGVSVFTVQKWRQKGIGPAFVKLAIPDMRTSPVRYEQAAIDAWLAQQQEQGSRGEVPNA